MAGRVFVVLSVLCACGDNIARDASFEPTSGTRLKLEGYAYLDGSRQWATGRYYDADLHARCTPQRWADDVLRCVPQADEAVFLDELCEMPIGRTFAPDDDEDPPPAFFIARTVVAGVSLPARLFRARQPTDPPAMYFLPDAGGCAGPFATPAAARHFLVGSEANAVALESAEHGEGRLALRMHVTADGLRAPLALHDRELAIDCRPAAPGDEVPCEPIDAPVAAHFLDPTCTTSAVAVPADTAIAAVARLDDEVSGCPAFHVTGLEHAGDIFVRDRGFCIRVPRATNRRYLAVAEPAQVATVSLDIDRLDDRRLQRMWLSTDGLFALHDRMFDTATRAVCVDRTSAGLTRCLPPSTLFGPRLYRLDCAVPVRASPVPQRACVHAGFATRPTRAPDEVPEAVHAIQVPYVGEALYHVDPTGFCAPYVPEPGHVLHALGPSLPDDTFAVGVPFGAR
jgi:hypothetical protein